MSIGLITVVTLLYLGVAVSEFRNQRPGMAITFLGYAFANLGLIMQIRT